jgi:hypothetical protein
MSRVARIAVTALLAVIPTAAPALIGAAAPAIADTSDLPVSITLGSIRPLAPQPNGMLTVTGTITNTSSDPVSNLGIDLEESTTALITRGSFDDYASDPTGALPIMRLVAQLPLHDPTLDTRQSEQFTVTVSVASLLLTDSWQVRELGLMVTGSNGVAQETLGQLRTFLPYAPSDASVGRTQVDLSWVWPLVDRPHRAVGNTFIDDDLAPEIAPGGRLYTLLQAALQAQTRPLGKHTKAPDPVLTYAVDPMLLEDLDLMRAGYKFTNSSAKTVAGTGTANAGTFLTELSTATSPGLRASQRDVLALPYGDPDIAAEVRAGLTTLLGLAIQSGTATLQRLLPGTNLVDADWPPGGLLDERSVDALIGDAVSGLLLSDQALPTGELSETPTALASLSTDAGTIPAVLTDSTLSDAVNAGANAGANSALATQRVMAETLMIEAEAPSDQRDIVIAPNRRWDPSPSFATSLLLDTGKAPWLKPVTLSQVLRSTPSKVDRQPLSYPATARHAELDPSYLGQIDTQQKQVSNLSSILPASDRNTLPYVPALLRASSSAWRSDAFDRNTQMAALQHSIGTAMKSVTIASVAGSHITLTSHGGQFPVTIANDLDVPVNVTVALEPTLRLTFAHDGREQRTIPAHQRLAVDFRATAKTSGVFPIKVQLLTPDGHAYGSRVTLYVRSTVYGTITLVITGAATAALLIAVGVRLTRRAIAARRAPAPTP